MIWLGIYRDHCVLWTEERIEWELGQSRKTSLERVERRGGRCWRDWRAHFPFFTRSFCFSPAGCWGRISLGVVTSHSQGPPASLAQHSVLPSSCKRRLSASWGLPEGGWPCFGIVLIHSLLALTDSMEASIQGVNLPQGESHHLPGRKWASCSCRLLTPLKLQDNWLNWTYFMQGGMSNLRKGRESPQSSEPGEVAQTPAFFSPGLVWIMGGSGQASLRALDNPQHMALSWKVLSTSLYFLIKWVIWLLVSYRFEEGRILETLIYPRREHCFV